MVDPDHWLEVLDGQRYVRKVRSNGTVKVDSVYYYVDQAWAGKYVSLQLDATQRAFVVEYREQPIKTLPLKGLVASRGAEEAASVRSSSASDPRIASLRRASGST